MHEPFVRANQGIVECGLNTVCWSKVIRRNIIRSNKEARISWLKEKRSLTPRLGSREESRERRREETRVRGACSLAARSAYHN